MPKMHLTLTGYHAGTPYCQCDKQSARNNGDDFMHLPYTLPDGMTILEWANSGLVNLCEECKAVLISVYTED